MPNYCTQCGAKLNDSDRFCPSCGAEIPDREASVPEADSGRKESPEPITDPGPNPKKPGENVVLCPDGKYRWMSEVHLLKDWSFFFLVWRIFFFIVSGIFVFMMILDLFEDGFSEGLWSTFKIYLYFLIGMTALVFIGYFIYAAVMGFRYCVVFEMNDKGVLHKQMPKQAKRAEIISMLTLLAGLASRSISTAAVGLNSARSESYTEFSRVRKLKSSRTTGKIRLKEGLSSNEVYVSKEDFAFVLDYISARCVNRKAD